MRWIAVRLKGCGRQCEVTSFIPELVEHLGEILMTTKIFPTQLQNFYSSPRVLLIQSRSWRAVVQQPVFHWKRCHQGNNPTHLQMDKLTPSEAPPKLHPTMCRLNWVWSANYLQMNLHCPLRNVQIRSIASQQTAQPAAPTQKPQISQSQITHLRNTRALRMR